MNTPIPTDDEFKQSLMKSAELQHQFLTVVMAIVRVVIVIGGIVVAVQIADRLTM
jgi:hypothetical protein